MPASPQSAKNRVFENGILFRDPGNGLLFGDQLAIRLTYGDTIAVRRAHHDALEDGLPAYQRSLLTAFEDGHQLRMRKEAHES